MRNRTKLWLAGAAAAALAGAAGTALFFRPKFGTRSDVQIPGPPEPGLPVLYEPPGIPAVAQPQEAAPHAPLHPPISRRGWLKLLLVAAVVVVAATASYAYHRTRLLLEQQQAAGALVGGNGENAPALLVRYGCAGCHSLSSVPQATGMVGPPLDNMARRLFIAGRLETTPENLIRWIVDPRSVDPETAMPRTGISAAEARDIVTHLYGQPG
jgi:cytochrome c2